MRTTRLSQSLRIASHAIFGVCGWRGSGANRARTLASVPRPRPPAAAPQPLHFDRFPLDRAGDKRQDQETINAMTELPESVVVVFVEGNPVVGPRGSAAVRTFSSSSGSSSSVLLDAEGAAVEKMPWVISMGYFKEILGRQPQLGEPILVFLGMHGTSPVFTASVSLDLESKVSILKEFDLEVVDARGYGPKLCAEDASVLASASGLLSWHRNAQFDPRTGKEATEIVLGGHGRRVPGEKRAQYPRIDPAVIVSVEHGEWLLLGRKKSWAHGRYSLLAGFVELSESLEDAACREVCEESGVAVSRASLMYHSSQPWPFPRSLMMGFTGRTEAIERAPCGFDLLPSREARMAAHGTGVLEDELDRLQASLTLPDIIVDEDEMEDIRWFHASYLRKQLNADSDNTKKDASEMRIPGKHAVASSIIHDCLDRLVSDSVLDVVQPVDLGPTSHPLDGSGLSSTHREMKYVLLRVSTMDGGPSGKYTGKFIVRGDPRASYHNHVFTHAKAELRQFDLDVLGGGRIVVDDDKRQMRIFGYSAAFGAAVHEISRAVLRQAYPLYDIDVSYDGY